MPRPRDVPVQVYRKVYSNRAKTNRPINVISVVYAKANPQHHGGMQVVGVNTQHMSPAARALARANTTITAFTRYLQQVKPTVWFEVPSAQCPSAQYGVHVQKRAQGEGAGVCHARDGERQRGRASRPFCMRSTPHAQRSTRTKPGSKSQKSQRAAAVHNVAHMLQPQLWRVNQYTEMKPVMPAYGTIPFV